MSNIELDPREVLMHLHEMGYYNITPQQLDEFITDLKKLIKFDMAKKKIISKPSTSTKMHYTEDSTSSTLPNTTEESVSPSPPPPPDQHKHWAHTRPGRSQSRHMDEASSSSSDLSITPSKRVLRECTKIAAQRAQEKENIIKCKHSEAAKVPAKPTKSCDCLWRRIGCKCCDENWNRERNSIKTAKSKENLAPPRPKSSFIRTWQLTGQARPGSAPQRSDPVTLYHQYQRLWKQQKLPGENNHNELRWSVRERMLGQEPHPRSCSCSCKCCPCKLTEVDFSNQPKKVSSRLLPRGPFHVDGRLTGPVGFTQDGKLTVGKRHLKGVFQLGSDCEEIKSQFHPKPSEYGTSDTRERATWLSKEDMDRVRKLKDDMRNTINEFRITEEELRNRRANHDRSTCKYCGVIHYMLNGHKPESSKGSSKVPYWPQQFARNEVQRENGASSIPSRHSPPSATSTPLSSGRRGGRQTFIVPKPTSENQPVDRCEQRSLDNYFENRVPIKLNDLEGEVKTGVEVFRRQQSCNGQRTGNGNNAEPLFVVATEPLSQASSVTSVSRRSKRL